MDHRQRCADRRTGGEEKLKEVQYAREDRCLEASRDDDFVGVQSYSVKFVDENGIMPDPPSPDNTLTGARYRPDAIDMAVRHTWEFTSGTPIVITENGIATGDDERRIAYTTEALGHLFAAMDSGIDVRGYLHWSALDNFEWATGSRLSAASPPTARPSCAPRSPAWVGWARSPARAD